MRLDHLLLRKGKKVLVYNTKKVNCFLLRSVKGPEIMEMQECMEMRGYLKLQRKDGRMHNYSSLCIRKVKKRNFYGEWKGACLIEKSIWKRDEK